MNLTYWTGLALGIAVFLWPGYYTFRMKKYTQTELGEISPKYRQINKAYLRHGIWWAILFIPILVGLATILDYDDPAQGMNILAAYIVLAFSAAAFFYGSFAAKYGLYPASKYFGPNTTYAYVEPMPEIQKPVNWPSIKQIGRIQMGVSAGFGVTALIVVLWLYLGV